MGCDIHLFVQAQVVEALETGAAPPAVGQRSGWRLIRPPSDLFRAGTLLSGGASFEWDVGRSYRLFAPLAGVRDYSREGVMASHRFSRGLPSDLDTTDGEFIGLVDDPDWLGAHSSTHFTVEEMLADPVWGQMVTERGDRGTWRDLNRWWFDNAVPALLSLGPPDRVRLVMGFDS